MQILSATAQFLALQCHTSVTAPEVDSQGSDSEVLNSSPSAISQHRRNEVNSWRRVLISSR